MNKRALIHIIIAKLTSEVEVYFRAAQASRAEATHEQSKAECKYDARGLEASCLAHASAGMRRSCSLQVSATTTPTTTSSAAAATTATAATPQPLPQLW